MLKRDLMYSSPGLPPGPLSSINNYSTIPKSGNGRWQAGGIVLCHFIIYADSCTTKYHHNQVTELFHLSKDLPCAAPLVAGPSHSSFNYP